MQVNIQSTPSKVPPVAEFVAGSRSSEQQKASTSSGSDPPVVDGQRNAITETEPRSMKKKGARFIARGLEVINSVLVRRSMNFGD